jgi:hypothetical protein
MSELQPNQFSLKTFLLWVTVVCVTLPFWPVLLWFGFDSFPDFFDWYNRRLQQRLARKYRDPATPNDSPSDAP